MINDRRNFCADKITFRKILHCVAVKPRRLITCPSTTLFRTNGPASRFLIFDTVVLVVYVSLKLITVADKLGKKLLGRV